MQLILTWPANINLALPETIKQSLIAHLIVPFGDEESAKSFWSEYPSTLIIIDDTDSIATLNKLPQVTQQQIKFAISNPEYSDDLGMGYRVNLSITNDEGTGIYLIIPPKSQLRTNNLPLTSS